MSKTAGSGCMPGAGFTILRQIKDGRKGELSRQVGYRMLFVAFWLFLG